MSRAPSHPSVEDNHRYPRAVIQLADAVDAFADASLEAIQDILNGNRAYRLTVYNELMRVPVAEAIVGECTKETVRTFLTTALAEKPTAVITTDGRSNYPEIVEDDLDAFHHRCRFYFIKNGEKKLRNRVFQSVRYSNTEKLRGAIVWSEL